MEERWENVPEFPQFKSLVLEDKLLFDTLFQEHPPHISELTFTNLFIWRHQYRPQIARLGNFLCLLSSQDEKSFFFPPIGEGNVLECIAALLHDLKRRGLPPKVARMPEERVSQINWEGHGMVVQQDRDQSDYVYLAQDLIRLEGRKYHRKRNHIKQFREKYSWQYLPITPEWIPECLRLQTEWCDLRQCDVIPGLASEALAIRGAFDHYEALGLMGGAILIDGRLEAFTLGELLNPDTVVIHIEKANPAFEGLYPTINQVFLAQHWSQVSYVNREQDLGEEGLRKAKESYFPHHLVHKYSVTLRPE